MLGLKRKGYDGDLDSPASKRSFDRGASQGDHELEDDQHQMVDRQANQNLMANQGIDTNSFSSSDNLEFFENDSLKLFLQKSEYQRGTKFSHLDSLFNIKIIPKADPKNPLFLKDILDILDQGLKYILAKLKSFFPENPNTLSFLTLYQDGMTNGLSTGGYSLGEESSLMVDKLMQMVFNFLLSDENLVVNKGFKIYVDVYSKEHNAKRKKIYKGRTLKPNPNFPFAKQLWSLDVGSVLTQSDVDCFLKDKCLLSGIILGHQQNLLIEKGSNRFAYSQKLVYWNNKKKRNFALSVIKEDVLKLFTYLQEDCKVANVCDIYEIAPFVHDIFCCQIIIFSGLSNKISFMYPKEFDESLRPIFLHDQDDNQTNHVVYVRNLTGYFRYLKTKVCLVCKGSRKSLYQGEHSCKQRKSCLACKRFFLNPERTPSEYFRTSFCPGSSKTRDMTDECKVCQLKLSDATCKTIHQKGRFCGKGGHLGFKCKRCNRYYHRNKKFVNAAAFAKLHRCGEKLCETCKQYTDSKNHLCKLQVTNFRQESKCLAFLTMEFIDTDKNGQFTNNHPNIVTIYKETSPSSGKFNLQLLTDFEYAKSDDPSSFDFPYHVGQNLPLPSLASESGIIQDGNLGVKMGAIQSRSPKSCSEKLANLIVGWKDTTIICNDEDGFVFQAIIKALLGANLFPKISKRNKKFFEVSLPELRIRILNMANYIKGTELEKADLSKLKFDQVFFPQKFNQVKNYGYRGKIPDVDYFISIFEPEIVQEEKKVYVKHFRGLWDFKDQLVAFSRQKTELLSKTTLLFVKEFYLLQQKMHSVIPLENSNRFLLVSPFAGNLTTFSGFIFTLYKGLFLSHFEIFSVKNEYHVPSRKVSQTETEFCKFLEFKNPNLQIISNFSNPCGQEYFKEAVPDVYIPELKMAIFVNGCYFHGHYKGDVCPPSQKNLTDSSFNEIFDPTPDQTHCLLSKPGLPDTLNKRMNKSYQSLQREFFEKIDQLKQNNPDKIETVKVFWECFYKKQISGSPDHKLFLKSYVKHPLRRLVPRDCGKGGLTQAFALSWNQQENSDETFYCCDINGLYSHVAMAKMYNVGEYQILIGKALKEISQQNGKLFFEGKKLYGTALISFVPPRNLFVPFLIYKHEQSSVLILCRKCFLKKSKTCKHSDSERTLTGSYFIEEIEFAMTLGYRITAIHECHAYFDQGPVFKKFISILSYYKTKFSPFLEKVETDKRAEHCKRLNEKMNFEIPFLLTPNDQPDSFKKYLFKLAANSLFGKMQQRKDKPSVHTVTENEELERILADNKEDILSIEAFNDMICQVSVKQKENKLQDSQRTNCYLGSQVVALARIYFYEQILKVLECKGTLFYVDTDCIFFSLKKHLQNPLDMSEAIGDFKSVYSQISHFYCLGPKNYTIASLAGGKTSVTTKVRGLNLNSPVAEHVVNSFTHKTYLKSFLKKNLLTLKVPQLRTRRVKKHLFSSKTQLEFLSFSNTINTQRFFIRKSSSLSTLPYGF